MPFKTDDILAPALKRLDRRSAFSLLERTAFLDMPFHVKRMVPSAYIVREQDPTKTCCILLSGFAFRSKIVGNGDRQILSVNIPGEILNLQHAFPGTADYSIQMLTAGDVAFVAAEAVHDIAFAHPAVGRAMWIETLAEGSICREWLANIGRRDARTRVAHLLCEIAVRLHAAGLITGTSYDLPMTQEQLGDATGLTPVHVNRTLQKLRSDGLITRDKRAITIENWTALSSVGDFVTDYLHLDTEQV